MPYNITPNYTLYFGGDKNYPVYLRSETPEIGELKKYGSIIAAYPSNEKSDNIYKKEYTNAEVAAAQAKNNHLPGKHLVVPYNTIIKIMHEDYETAENRLKENSQEKANLLNQLQHDNKDNIVAIHIEGDGLLGDDGAKILAEFIPSTSKLKYIHILDKTVTTEGIKAITANISQSNIKFLSLLRCKIEDSGYAEIAKNLKNMNLQVLNLENTWLTENGAKNLVTALEHEKIPTKFCIHEDKIQLDPEANKALGELVNYLNLYNDESSELDLPLAGHTINEE